SCETASFALNGSIWLELPQILQILIQVYIYFFSTLFDKFHLFQKFFAAVICLICEICANKSDHFPIFSG
ncbi:MAG TPA: hypothetical protein DEB71_20885, partial [Chryseobacterium carnipullorum]|nr:hypothetical protein [Chryseobacterium carnipullorum]